MDDHADASDATPDPTPEPTAKKPYRKPVLVKLGNLADITRATGYFGQNDGGRFPRGFKTGN